MSTTLTIRTDEALREALPKRASAQGKTVSEVARDFLRSALEERTSHWTPEIRHTQMSRRAGIPFAVGW